MFSLLRQNGNTWKVEKGEKANDTVSKVPTEGVAGWGKPFHMFPTGA